MPTFDVDPDKLQGLTEELSGIVQTQIKSGSLMALCRGGMLQAGALEGVGHPMVQSALQEFGSSWGRPLDDLVRGFDGLVTRFQGAISEYERADQQVARQTGGMPEAAPSRQSTGSGSPGMARNPLYQDPTLARHAGNASQGEFDREFDELRYINPHAGSVGIDTAVAGELSELRHRE
jgi:hypothetical protein